MPNLGQQLAQQDIHLRTSPPPNVAIPLAPPPLPAAPAPPTPLSSMGYSSFSPSPLLTGSVKVAVTSLHNEKGLADFRCRYIPYGNHGGTSILAAAIKDFSPEELLDLRQNLAQQLRGASSVELTRDSFVVFADNAGADGAIAAMIKI